ncbi:MAG: penicillin-binding protein 2, penicillin-binding protein 2 [Parcubacteria group bacterium]|nr:penicillin-binding protein 2, penicillin-binding protein 2 [Parcubacteria group bacterium]
MLNKKIKEIFGGYRRLPSGKNEIDPDEIFLDSSNLPRFDNHQFEGRLVSPISKRNIALLATFFILAFIVFGTKIWSLQITGGEKYSKRSENNRLRHVTVFSPRGVIYDRNNKELAWNIFGEDKEFALRKYTDLSGFSHILGYVKYPAKDSSGFYYNEDYVGKTGVEKFFNNEILGENGLKIAEINALGKIESESVIRPPKEGGNLVLSIDSRIQNKFHEAIAGLAQRAGFSGGAGVIMDVNNGEILAMANYPEYSSQVMSDGKDDKAIQNYLEDKNNPFLNRVVDGLYTPGSIVKPFVALAALTEKIISPSETIFSGGSITVPNIYDPSKPSVFTETRAHGYVDMRKAIAESSNVYFYEVGGGYGNQKGLGIYNIEKYIRMFGFGSDLSDGFFSGKSGIVPNPEWKKENFGDSQWRIGDTYNTSIGQYGFQVTPIQVARAVSAIANGGKLLNPSIILNSQNLDMKSININQSDFQVVREGMRGAVLYGTAVGLNIPQVEIAAKTGTAQLGTSKKFVNSWAIGFFPYEHPKYAFAVLMEKGPSVNLIGGLYVMRELLDWMSVNTPQYLE